MPLTRPRRDDDDWYPLVYLGIGTAHAIGEGEDKPDPIGRLYVPDPEQRHGWREYYIRPAPQEKPGRRPIGFGRS